MSTLVFVGGGFCDFPSRKDSGNRLFFSLQKIR